MTVFRTDRDRIGLAGSRTCGLTPGDQLRVANPFLSLGAQGTFTMA